MTNEQKAQKLTVAKRLVLVTLLLYLIVFFCMNFSYLTKDNIRRFVAGVQYAMTSKDVQAKDMIVFSDDNDVCTGIFKDGIVVLTQNKLTVYSRDGFVYSEHEVHLRTPVLRVSDRYILCYDRGGTNVYLADSFNIVWQDTFEDSIISATLADNGSFAVAIRQYEHKGRVLFYEHKAETPRIGWSLNEYIMDLHFTQSNTLSVLTLALNEGKSDTYVHVLNYNKATEQRVHTLENMLPLAARGKEDRSVELLTENKMVSVRRDGYLTTYTMDRTPQTVWQDSRYTMMMTLQDAAQRLYSITAIDAVGNLQFTAEFAHAKNICCFRDLFLVLADDTLYTLDRTGTVLGSAKVASDATSILASEESVFVCGFGFAQRIDVFSYLN